MDSNTILNSILKISKNYRLYLVKKKIKQEKKIKKIKN